MTAKAEFKKWYSACRACVRDQRNAGADGRFIADHKGVRFSAGYAEHMNGLTRANLYRSAYRSAYRFDNVMWHDALNDIMKTPVREIGKGWLRATLNEMPRYRLHTY